MHSKVLFPFLAVVACATAASIYGGAGIDRNSIFAHGRFTFPSIFGFKNNQSNSINSTNLNSTGISLERSATNTFLGLGNLGKLFANLASDFLGSLIALLPDFESTLSGIHDFVNATSINLPSIPNLPDPANAPYVPGVSEALMDARNHLQGALNITTDISTGIHDAIVSAVLSGDPVGACRTIIETILKVYGTVAEHCPVIIVGERVIQEGLQLSIETLRSMRNIAVGP